MKLFIQVLDNGYMVSQTIEQEVEGQPPVERKRRFAFETKRGLETFLNRTLEINQLPHEEADDAA